MKQRTITTSILLSLLLLPACSSFLDNFKEFPTEGNFTEIGTGNISTGNHQIIVLDDNSIFSGLEISVNDDYSGPSADFTIESGNLPDKTFSEYFTPLEEMLRIRNGGEYSENTFFVKIPISTTSGEIPLVFSYNESTESLDPLPILSYDETSLTFASRNFIQSTFSSDLKSTTSTDVKDFTNILVGTFILTSLEQQDVIMSDFQPGIDDWDFTNYGSIVEPKGNCTGHSLSALFYYDYKTWANSVGLTNLYDRDSKIWEDNTLGIRLVSEIQSKNFEISIKTIWNDFYTHQPFASPDDFYDTYQKSAFATTSAQLLISQKPIYTEVAPRDSLAGLHAVLIIGVNTVDSILYIADPNFPGKTRTTTLKSDGYFDYVSGINARAGNNILYERFLCMGFSQMKDWKIAADCWRKLEEGTIGDDRFPTCEYYFTFNADSEDPNVIQIGEIDKSWLAGLSVSRKQPSIELRCIAMNNNRAVGNNIWIWANSEWIKSPRDKDYVILDLEEHELYNSTIGILISKPTQVDGVDTYSWIDFKWLNISEISISPHKMNGDVNTEYSWEITLGDPPTNTRFEWNFGDGTETVEVKNSNSAKHTYTEEGIFPIMVMAYNDDTNESHGVATGTATIGDAEFELIIKDSRSGEIIDNEADICTFFRFEFSVPAWIPDDYSLRYDLGEPETSSTLSFRWRPIYAERTLFEMGHHTIKVELLDQNGIVVDEISRDLNVIENDFFDMLTPCTQVSASISGFNTTHYMDDGSDGSDIYIFYFQPWTWDNAPEANISWSGRSFTYHQKFEDLEVRMEGTLSASSWNLLTFKAFYKNGSTEYSLETSNIQVQGPPCPLWPPEQISYGLYGLDLEDKFSLSGHRYKDFGQKLVTYSHSEFTESSSFEINFYNR